MDILKAFSLVDSEIQINIKGYKLRLQTYKYIVVI